MDPDTGQIVCRVGDEVVGSDEGKIGKVAAFDPWLLTVEHGLLRKERYYVPMAAVNSCAEGRVYLTVRKDEVAHQGWNVPPPAEEAETPPVPR